MKVTPFGPIRQVTFLPSVFPVNCYLVEEENELTLIDAALPYSWKGILKAAESMGRRITRIILTHAHDDHVGALDRLKEELGDVKIYISRRDSRLMDGDRSLEPGEASAQIRGGVPKKMKARADILVQEGDMIGSLQVISAPGHTPGSIALLHRETRALIAGDAFHSVGRVTVSGGKNLRFPFPAIGTWHKETALDSARKLKELAPAVLACGHGKIMHDPDAAMAQAISNLQQECRGAEDAKKTGR
ncbi:MBL fold metallo-hydrolase [Peribacillus kribbensis]|uniref:MBL fold metallo-hydrolase n=1 Tax=Peribacillus kribbensis TaxID=356658 RepID=UPI0004080EE5|nr:MBL fold metallo-hydrolase [Peribacillus kribbensis]